MSPEPYGPCAGKMIADCRLDDILNSWRLSTDETGDAYNVTPAAHVAREQVIELVAEVRRLKQLATLLWENSPLRKLSVQP